MHRTSSRVLLTVAAFVLFLVPVAAIAAGGFTDVDEDSVFKTDIAWLADAGVTKGCNPPTNDKFCPESNVTREQMSAFMHRLAVNKVVDARTAMDADNLDGKDSTAFATSGHDHDSDYLAANGKADDADRLDGLDSTAFLTKAAHDSDEDGVIDSAEIKIRRQEGAFDVDMAVEIADRVKCATAPVTFDSPTTVAISGGLSLRPKVASTVVVYGHIYSRNVGVAFWSGMDTFGMQGTPPSGTGYAAMPMNTVGEFPAGTYVFSIRPHGADLVDSGPDYNGYCELIVTAYTGQGTSIDYIPDSTGSTSQQTQVDG